MRSTVEDRWQEAVKAEEVGGDVVPQGVLGWAEDDRENTEFPAL